MTYFRYSFLNSLRDELGLTMTRQKVTLFALLYLAIPACGLGVGIGWGVEAHSPVKTIIGSAIGLMIGGVIAWSLPRLLWSMLRLFLRKGWFQCPQRPQSVPTMTSSEFIARSEVLRRKVLPYSLLWSLLFIAGASGCSCLAFYMDRARPHIWIQVLAGVGMPVCLVGYVYLSRRAWKRIVSGLGLQCPSCGREITDAAGLSRIPYMGVCRHCGTKVVET